MKFNRTKLLALSVLRDSKTAHINGTSGAANSKREEINALVRQAQGTPGATRIDSDRYAARTRLLTGTALQAASADELAALGIDPAIAPVLIDAQQHWEHLMSQMAHLSAEARPFLEFMTGVDHFIADAKPGALQFVNCPSQARSTRKPDAVRADLEAVRARHLPLGTELAHIEQHPHSLEDCAAIMDRKIEDWAAQADRSMRAVWGDLAAGGRFARFLNLRLPQASGDADIGPLAVALLGPDAVRAALLKYAGDVPEGKDREKRIATLKAQLDQVEIEEERLVCELESLAQPVQRRADARVELAAAVDENQPK